MAGEQRFDLGDVVERRWVDNGRERHERGVIVGAHGEGETHHMIIGPRDRGYVVELSRGHHLMSDSLGGHWTEPGFDRVSRDRWTTLERVRSADVTWERPHWLEPDEDVPEPHSYYFATLQALLPPPVTAQLFGDGDWPTSFDELVKDAAPLLDDYIDGQRRLASARARIGHLPEEASDA